MKRITMALALCLLLCGCGREAEPVLGPAERVQPEQSAPAAAAPVPEPTVAPDGNADDVTCKGSYSVPGDAGAVVAQAGDAQLTNAQLQAWYWAEAARLRNSESGPDYSQPLDTQPCSIDDSVNSWQQYFLREALNAWHTAQGLILQAQTEGLPVQEAYNPNKDNHATYMEGKPVTKVLYGYNESYEPNRLHQDYLDGIEGQLTAEAARKGYDSLESYAQGEFGTSAQALQQYMFAYNFAYMYFTTMSDYCEPTQEEIDQARQEQPVQQEDEEPLVSFRQVLVEDQEQAEALLKQWQKERRVTEGTFGNLAYQNSLDAGTQKSGGAYSHVRRDQVMPELAQWLFDGTRLPGDTTIVTSPKGCHILYFVQGIDVGTLRAQQGLHRAYQLGLLQKARDSLPVQVHYDQIFLQEAQGTVAAEDLLYPDIAHERYPDAPLYLQQDFIGTKYNGSDVTKTGCGITTMAMLASYMTDKELTVADMCQTYGRYGGAKGTDGMIFVHEPPEMGFYLIDKLYDARLVKPYLDQGYPIVVIQHKGFWTRGGHYLLLEKVLDNGLIQVRDSNIYNYNRLEEHQQDAFPWSCITPQGKGYWIFEKKVTRIPACTRCGSGNEFVSDYLCQKCETALLRRGNYADNP